MPSTDIRYPVRDILIVSCSLASDCSAVGLKQLSVLSGYLYNYPDSNLKTSGYIFLDSLLPNPHNYRCNHHMNTMPTCIM